MIRSIQRFAAVLGMMLLLTAAFGQAPAAEAPIDAGMKQRDVRLVKPVTFTADRMYLGELLEALSAKTGVTLSMDNNDNFSGIMIACDLKQMPLAEVMNSLWSLVGSRNGLWEWRADTRQTPIRYSFRPTPDAHALAERLHQAMQETLEAKAEVLVRMAFMSPEERKAHADDLLPLMQTEDPDAAQKAVEDQLAREESWAGIKLFAGLLSADQRTRVLRGETIEIPSDSLSQEDRRATLSLEAPLKANYNTGQEGGSFNAIRFGGQPEMPSFYPGDHLEVLVGFVWGDTFSGRDCITVGAYDLFPRFFADWILPGDVRTRDIETRPMGSLGDLKLDEVWKSAPMMDRNLAQIAATEDASFMAVVPGGAGVREDSDGFPPAGPTPAEYFRLFWRLKMLMHKWRAGVLLFHYPQWFYGDDVQCSYGIIKRLRATLKKQDGVFSLADIAELISTLTVRQLTHLTEDFPLFEGYPIMTMGQRYPQPLTALCAFYKSYPKCLSETGLPLDLKMQTYLHDLRLWPTWLKEGERVTAVRISDVSEPFDVEARHTYTLEFTTSRQPWKGDATFWTGRIERKPPASIRNALPVETDNGIESPVCQGG